MLQVQNSYERIDQTNLFHNEHPWDFKQGEEQQSSGELKKSRGELVHASVKTITTPCIFKSGLISQFLVYSRVWGYSNLIQFRNKIHATYVWIQCIGVALPCFTIFVWNWTDNE